MTDETDVAIEPATRDDLEPIASFWVTLADEQAAYGSHVRPAANYRTMFEVLAAQLEQGGLFVARAGDRPVGFASFSVERGAIELDTARGTLSNIYVEPTYRDRGIGSALLDAVEDELADRGVETLTLEAMAANEAARRFYRNRGYETNRVTMERRIDEAGKNDTHSKEDR